MIENSLPRLRAFARLGARYLTLTHVEATGWADSSGPWHGVNPDPRALTPNGRLSDFGTRVVREMNRLGMAVDVSHASDATVARVLEVSRAPVFASHSGCRALAGSPRNLTDAQMKAIAARGGVVMVIFSSALLDQRSFDAVHSFAASVEPQLAALRVKHAGNPAAIDAADGALWKTFTPVRASWTAVVDHLEHIMRLAPGAAGLGSDFDGADDFPEGLGDVAAVPGITEELLRRGHSEAEVRGVLGENFLRFLGRVERTAAQLKHEPPDATSFAPAH